MSIGCRDVRKWFYALLSMSRHESIILKGLLIMVLFCGCANAQQPEHETLVAGGEAACVIIVSADAPGGSPGIAWVREAAASIAEYIERSTGATVEVVTSPPENDLVQVHIGQTDYVRERGLTPADIDGDGFVIAFPEPGRIVLVGGSDWGTEFAAYEFLERFVGVRWLFPGELGEYVPQHDALVIPRSDIRQEPAYFSRLISEENLWGARRANELNIWVHRLRMHHRIYYHHNLNNLLPVAQYTDTNPEWYPLVNGERIQAADADRHRHTWAAPVLDAPGLTEEIVKNIHRFFAENPNAESVSLGINDTHNWDREGGPPNSVGLPDQSDYYYPWVNRVVEEVLQTHPDKWFGLLAYLEVMDPPTDPLHERVIPYITYDRHWWLRELLARRDQQRVHDWREKASQVGWYDYSYGRFFIAPRMYIRLMAEYLRWGAENGVRTYYSEAYPSADWHEGPKVYAQMKLLWDPWLDVEELLDEWYHCAVGAQAAPALKAYFEFWEEFWTQRIFDHGWFYATQSGDTWLPFSAQGYLTALTPEDLAACDRWMAEVTEKAGTTEEQARAAFFNTAWENIRDNEILQWMVELRNDGPVANAFAADAANSERISFSGFEPAGEAADMPEGWSSWQRRGSTHGFRWEQADGYQSNGSLVVDLNSRDLGSPAAFTYSQHVEPKRYCKVRSRVRVQDLNPAAAVCIAISWANAPASYRMAHLVDTSREGEWVVGELVARVPDAEDVSMALALIVTNGTAGTVWFDDVEILVLKDGILP